LTDTPVSIDACQQLAEGLSMPDEYRVPASRAPWRFLLAALALVATVAGIALISTGGAQAATVTPLDTAAASSPGTGPSAPDTSPFPPSAVTNLTAVVHATSVTLSWTAATPGCCPVTGYNISYFRAYADLGYDLQVGNVTTATVTRNLLPASQYRFNVSAQDTTGYRGPSTSITVVTPASDTGPDTVPPGTPGTLVLGEVTPTTAALSWSPATDNVGVVGYEVYRYDGWASSTLLATVTGTAYTATLARTGSNFNQFYIRARDAAGNVSLVTDAVYVNMGSLPSASASASPSRSISRPPVPSCRVVYQVQSQWGGGFVAGVTITNTSSAPIAGWTLTFTFAGDERITNAWNATVSQTGSSVSLGNVGWNATIAPGSSVSPGFQGTGQAGVPTHFALNGIGCTG